MEFQTNFTPYDVTRMNRDQWEAEALSHTIIVSNAIIEREKRTHGPNYNLPPLQLEGVPRNRSLSVLQDMYRFDQRFAAGDVSIGRRGLFYSGLAREIRNKKQYSLIGSIYNELKSITPIVDPAASTLLRYGVYSLYLLVCEPDRFLVGLKDGVHWKKASISTEKGENPAITNMATHYVPMLDRIGRRELGVVPQSILHPSDFTNIHFPASKLTIDDILEDAYYHQRYLVPLDGADVRFRRAGDLARICMVQSGDEVIAKVQTAYGDEQVIINLEDSSYITPEGRSLRLDQQSPWATIVTETYHDLVTADELPVTRYGRMRKNNQQRNLDDEWNFDDPQVIYIPRKTRVIEYERPRYDGPVRPIKPHLVTNYFRTANITDEHIREVLELEKEWGLKKGEIVDNIPEGKTWVRPHFSPRGSEIVMKTGPIFIKRRILAQTGIKLWPSFPKTLE